MFLPGLFLLFLLSGPTAWGVHVSWENWRSAQLNSGAEFEPPASKPHIVFILVDDQGFRDVGYHGSEIKTPNLDRLAAQGVKLENYYVQPLCSPSRSQLMTGRYQIHTGLQHSIIRATQPNCLPVEDVTLPQKLREAGYSTHMVGKWHLGFYKRSCLPTQRGFDTFFGSLLGSGDYYSHYKCEGAGMCGYDLYEGEEAAWEQDRGLYSTVMFTRKAINLLANHNPHSQPLFLYLAYQAVHSPLQVPARYVERYKGIPNPHRRKYAAMVSCLDEAIHNLTQALKHYGYYDNTVIVYSTDNGGQPLAGGSNWPLRGSKATYWEGGIRGVGFVHSPLLVKKGSKCRGLIHITDWFPTLVTLGGGTLDEDLNLDGYDVWEAISEGRPSPRLDILHNIDPIYTKAKNGSWKAGYGLWNTAIQAALRVGHWKLLTGVPGYSDWVPPQTFSNQRLTTRHHNERVRWDRGKSIWLFNITADPYERVDLSQRFPHIVKKMLMRLVQFNKTAVPVRYPAKDLRSNPQYNGGVWGPWFKDQKQNWEEEEDGYNNMFTNHLTKRWWKNKSKKRKIKRRAEHG
ncbi:arylsulfatase J [Cyprinodon tularosa]|uniref:arylsulfatase J n=1 Tax=Cyprinodon tularosa TaxID=77115 RepID=UPI0018E23F02|nr:arylsulfatase J [Cyprinodon tularosa]